MKREVEMLNLGKTDKITCICLGKTDKMSQFNNRKEDKNMIKRKIDRYLANFFDTDRRGQAIL